jgi:type IV secretion system protein TrbL
VLLFAWVIVILAFFILAVQMFVTIIEFKLTSLAGFILVPFALWSRTSFLAERVLGNVVSSGVKVMVLGVIVGIGSNFFAEFTISMQGQEPDLGAAMSLTLGALALFGLGIFGPGIASGLVAGAPQLGAGAAVGTAVGASGVTMLAGGATVGAARAFGGAALSAIRAGTTMGSAASASYQLGQTAAGSSSVGAGIGGMTQAASNTVRQKASAALGLSQAAERGRDAAASAINGGVASAGSATRASTDGAPAWAQSLRRQQNARHHRHVAMQSLKEGDRGGASATPDIKERED